MDKYDDEIEALVLQPGLTLVHWQSPYSFDGLFARCQDGASPCCGCLTQVHSHNYPSQDARLTSEIRADNRLHDNSRQILDALLATDDLAARRRILQVYADYQRDMDDTIRKGLPWKANRSRVPEVSQ